MNAKKPIYAIARRLLSFAAEDRTLITVGALLIVVSSAAETAIPNYSARALAAIIADAGAEVAVKVQHEGVEKLMASDIGNMLTVCEFLQSMKVDMHFDQARPTPSHRIASATPSEPAYLPSTVPPP